MRFTVKAYNFESIPYLGFLCLLYKNIQTDVVEIEVDAQDENEAIGKARQLVRGRNHFEVIKVRS
jgi:hypothetical protein